MFGNFNNKHLLVPDPSQEHLFQLIKPIRVRVPTNLTCHYDYYISLSILFIMSWNSFLSGI